MTNLMPVGSRVFNKEDRFVEIEGKVWITSMYVAEVTEKRHDNVMRDTHTIIEESDEEFGLLNFEESSYINSQNKLQPMYLLSEDGCSVLMGGYSISHRIKIQKELRTFKERAVVSAPSYMIENPIERAEKWINEQKEKQKLEEERDYAIKTKAWISDKKTASAMGKLGAAVKEKNALKDKLGESKRLTTVKAMENKYKEKFPWGPLKNYCLIHGLFFKKVPCESHGEVNAYPAEAWLSVYGKTYWED
jgi:Rha family phage regulatory protein